MAKHFKTGLIILLFSLALLLMAGTVFAAENPSDDGLLSQANPDKISDDTYDWDDYEDDYEEDFDDDWDDEDWDDGDWDDYDDWDDYAVKKSKKTKLTIKAPKVTKKYKKSGKFTIKVKANKKPAKSIKLKVKVKTNGKYKIYKLKTNKKGVAYINIKNLKIGKHKVIITPLSSKFKGKASSWIKITKK